MTIAIKPGKQSTICSAVNLCPLQNLSHFTAEIIHQNTAAFNTRQRTAFGCLSPRRWITMTTAHQIQVVTTDGPTENWRLHDSRRL